MKVNIQTVSGLKQVQSLKKPFEINGIWFFVEKDSDYGYVISEWQTGFKFTYADYEEEILFKINSVFEKISLKRIRQVIQKCIKKHGIANEGFPGNSK